MSASRCGLCFWLNCLGAVFLVTPSLAAGGLMNLVQFGAQDVYLSSAPSVAPAAESEAVPSSQLMQACIDAGIIDATECDAFIAYGDDEQAASTDETVSSEGQILSEEATFVDEYSPEEAAPVDQGSGQDPDAADQPARITDGMGGLAFTN